MGQAGDSHEPGEPRRTYAWETVHVFVSSTFNDMHGERDYLVKEVFPELRDWCEERKLRLVDIDLRWGVSEADATHNQRVVEVCLQNIDRCRPFFLCFLGQRYGWIPGLGDVSAETLAKYPGLKAAITEQRSVTELEVLHAVVAPFVGGSAKLAADQSFFYLREPGYLKEMPAEPAQLRRIYTDEAEEDARSRAFLVDRQNKLRAAVSGQKQRPVRSYSAHWNPKARTPALAMPLDCPATLSENQNRWRRDWRRSGVVSIPESALSVPPSEAEKARAYNERLTAGRLHDFMCTDLSLGKAIQKDLQEAIAARFAEHMEVTTRTELEREIELHEEFVYTATRGFVARSEDFEALDAYVDGNEQKPFALVAAGGMGKSTLLAKWVAQRREKQGVAGEILCCRFVGVGDRSTSVDSLLRYLLPSLGWRHVSQDPNRLREDLLTSLRYRADMGKTILVIDALNQLDSGLADLDWLPRSLPKNAKLIVSFKVGDAKADELAKRWRASRKVIVSAVKPFDSLDDRKAVAREYLKEYLKELDQRHLDAIVSSPGGRYPLYLNVVLSELRVFGAFAQLGQVIQDTFGDDPTSAFDAVLVRLERDPAESAVPLCDAVPLLFGLIAHSHGGLPEEALVRIFLHELDLPEDRRDVVRATIQLLLRQVRSFLARRDGRTDFFYESFQIAAKQRYTSESGRPASAWHRILASFCEQWAGLTGSAQRYALRNLPSHMVAAGKANRAAEVMTEFGYHYERLRRLGREDVANITTDLVRVDGAAGLVPAEHGRLGVWKAFHAENAHLLGRQGVAPQRSLLQLALAHADTSPVTEGAERWLEHVGSEAQWLRPASRQHGLEHSACLRTLEGHTGLVNAVALLPDGKRGLSGSSDGTLKLWDLETGQCLRTIKGHRDTIEAGVLLADGRRFLTGGNDKTLKLWDLETGQCLRTLKGHTDEVNAVTLLPDGGRALSGGKDGTLKLWDLETGRCLRTLEGHTSSVLAVAALPDGRRALSGSWDQTLKLWDLETGQCLRTLEGHTSHVTAVAPLPNGKRGLSGSNDDTLKLWNLKSGRCLRTLKGHTGSVDAVAALPDGKRAISGSYDKTLKLWDLETGQCLRTLKGHADIVSTVVLLVDGRGALSGSSDETVKLWDLETGQCEGVPEGHTETVSTVALLPDGKRALSGSVDNTLKLWDLGTGQCLRTLKGHRPDVWGHGGVEALAPLPDGGRALSGGKDGTLKLWDLETGRCLRTMHGHGGFVYAVATLPDGRRAISGSGDENVKLWNLETGRCLRTLKGHTGFVRVVAALPDGKRAISGSDDKTLKLWDLETGQCLRTLEGHTNLVISVAALPDGKRAISGSRDRTPKLWDLETGQCLRTLEGHQGSADVVALLPDGRCALSGSWDHTLNLWNLDTGECLRSLAVAGHTDKVRAVAALPDGKRGISGSSDNALKLWDLESGLCLATWQATGSVGCLAAGPEVIVAGTGTGEVLFLRLMPPGRIVPETTAATWHPSRPLLAVTRANGTLLVQAWHPEAQHLEEIARVAVRSVASVQWSADGVHLFAITKDGTRRAFDGATLAEIRPAPTCNLAEPRDVSPDGAWCAVILDGRLEVEATSNKASS